MKMDETKSENEIEDYQFEKIMEVIGYRGKFQSRFNIIFNFIFTGVASMAYLNIILALAVPEHWCHIPGRQNTNYSLEEWRNLTIPIDTQSSKADVLSKCKMYNVSERDLYETKNKTTNIIDCRYGWDFDKTWYTETVASASQWVCKQDLYVSNIFAAGRIGDILGTFIFGQLGDTIGRRPVYILTLIILIVGRITFTFSAQNYYLMMFATLLGSLGSSAVVQAPLIVGMETTDDGWRAQIAMVQNIGWTIGVCLMPFIFWAVGDWFRFMLATTLPCVIFLILIRYMIESPRWLASQGKTEKCIHELEKIAKLNGTIVPNNVENILGKRTVMKEKSYGIVSLFSNWRLAKNTILTVIYMASNDLIYYVSILNITTLKGNPFLNFFWQNVVEIPSYFIAKYCCDKYGRRWTQTIVFILSAIASILTAVFINISDSEILVSVLTTFIKFCVAFILYAALLQSVEIFPTCVRQSGMSFTMITTNLLGILGPYIVYLGTAYDARYKPIIVAILSLSAALSVVFLPETLYQKLPETLEDAHVFGANQKFWSLPRKQK